MKALALIGGAILLLFLGVIGDWIAWNRRARKLAAEQRQSGGKGGSC